MLKVAKSAANDKCQREIYFNSENDDLEKDNLSDSTSVKNYQQTLSERVGTDLSNWDELQSPQNLQSKSKLKSKSDRSENTIEELDNEQISSNKDKSSEHEDKKSTNEQLLSNKELLHLYTIGRCFSCKETRHIATHCPRAA